MSTLRMSRADRARWQAACTLDDLGQTTADWWEGTVRSLPGHRASHRPHPTLTDRTPVLVAANRAGFLIPTAQAGLTDGTPPQRAAVQGFAAEQALIRRLISAAEKAGLEIVLNDWLDFEHDGPGPDATVSDRRDVVFGRVNLQAMWSKFPSACVITSALQITLADPQPGPSTRLWDTLAAAIGPAYPSPAPMIICRECGCTFNSTCADGCTGGVQDQDDGRCRACIDPSVIIDWSTNRDGEEKKCALDGAPFFHAGKYCSPDCEAADGYGDENQDEQLSPATHRPYVNHADDPWATGPV